MIAPAGALQAWPCKRNSGCGSVRRSRAKLISFVSQCASFPSSLLSLSFGFFLSVFLFLFLFIPSFSFSFASFPPVFNLSLPLPLRLCFSFFGSLFLSVPLVSSPHTFAFTSSSCCPSLLLYLTYTSRSALSFLS